MSEENKKEILAQAQALNDQELEDVAGGKTCVCAIGGGGEANQRGEKVCVCVAVGSGDFNAEGEKVFAHPGRCFCALGGGGDSTADALKTKCGGTGNFDSELDNRHFWPGNE